jgi:hypothetical protein
MKRNSSKGELSSIELVNVTEIGFFVILCYQQMKLEAEINPVPRH